MSSAKSVYVDRKFCSIANYLFGGSSVDSSARASNRKVAGSMPVMGITSLCLGKRLNANFLINIFF